MTSKKFTLAIALVSAAAVVLIGVIDLERTSPGPLSTVHGVEKDLDGGSNCSQCHGGWFTNMNDSCLECHEEISEQLDGHTGLHGVLANDGARCATCHSEHHGPGFAPVNRRSFVIAGFDGPEKFDHARIGFDMNGAHLALECAECHEHAADAVLAKGTTRFIGLDKSCTTCHEDPHKGEMAVACTSCHGQEKWDALHSDDHVRFLPLVGGHGDVGCRDCHAEGAEFSLETLGTAEEEPRGRVCIACHESKHAPSFVEKAAALAKSEVGASCVTCHAADHETFRDDRLSALTVEQHAASGFALAAPHDAQKCVDCHDPALADFAKRYPGRDADRCSACHDDPHGGQFAAGAFASGDCLACHAREHFEPHTFDVEQHARAAFALSGAHTALECSECHFVPRADAPREFNGTPAGCVECHGDAHDGFFDLAASEPASCVQCHDTVHFADVAKFDHAVSTGFAIEGAHAQEACESCHVLTEKPDDFGRRFGRVAEHFGKFSGCVTCHEDPHEARFDVRGLPREIDGRRDCARCHVATSFRSLRADFDHGRWTGFVLRDEHARAACSACHAPLRAPDEHGRTWQAAAGPECIDCHVEPHAGQFRVDDETDCARCHEAAAKNFLAFNHDRDARFALGLAHAEVECAACHDAWKGTNGAEVVRYRPLPRECTECHGAQADVLLRRKRREDR